jgi:hypothetical protein
VADPRTAGIHELLRALIDRGGESRRVSASMVDGGDVEPYLPGPSPFASAPDSKSAVYVADQETDGIHELYLAILPPLRPGGGR